MCEASTHVLYVTITLYTFGQQQQKGNFRLAKFQQPATEINNYTTVTMNKYKK